MVVIPLNKGVIACWRLSCFGCEPPQAPGGDCKRSSPILAAGIRQKEARPTGVRTGLLLLRSLPGMKRVAHELRAARPMPKHLNLAALVPGTHAPGTNPCSVVSGLAGYDLGDRSPSTGASRA